MFTLCSPPVMFSPAELPTAVLKLPAPKSSNADEPMAVLSELC